MSMCRETSEGARRRNVSAGVAELASTASRTAGEALGVPKWSSSSAGTAGSFSMPSISFSAREPRHFEASWLTSSSASLSSTIRIRTNSARGSGSTPLAAESLMGRGATPCRRAAARGLECGAWSVARIGMAHLRRWRGGPALRRRRRRWCDHEPFDLLTGTAQKPCGTVIYRVLHSAGIVRAQQYRLGASERLGLSGPELLIHVHLVGALDADARRLGSHDLDPVFRYDRWGRRRWLRRRRLGALRRVLRGLGPDLRRGGYLPRLLERAGRRLKPVGHTGHASLKGRRGLRRCRLAGGA